MNLIFQREPVARKKYNCNACEYILNNGSFNDFKNLTFAEFRKLVIAKNNKYKILKGEKYIRQFLSYENEAYEFLAIKTVHEICLKYKIYQD